MDINALKFANPQLLWLLLLLIPIVGYYIYRTLQGGATLQISSVRSVAGLPRSRKYYLRHIPFVLKCCAIALFIIALCRPQSTDTLSNSNTEGIDIMLALDISSSMLARDFKPDRISSAKDVAAKFIMDRPNDRIGLAVFAGESFTQSPLTSDKASLINLLGQVESGIIDDGTAIGNGLATAVNRLRESKAKSKVVILLTDGVNNMGQVAPLTAAEIAQTYGIKVYTIGVGSMGTAPYPAMDAWGNVSYVPMKVEIDEKILSEIANQTGGKYFRATDNTKLEAIYDQINSMETTEVEVENYTRYQEEFMIFVLFGLLALVGELLIRMLWLRSIP